MALILAGSGLAGLGYQVIWVRLLTVGLGHEAGAVLAVVAAFFVGLALGGLLANRHAARTARPGLIYAALEGVIALWALLLILFIAPFNTAMLHVLGPAPGVFHWAVVAFGLTFLLLAPATVAMGATLPYAERLYADVTGSTRGIGLLYGLNAGGAALGAVATLGVLSPALGFHGTLACLAVVNFACAVATIRGPARGEPRPPAPTLNADAAPRTDLRLVGLLFLTGLAGVGVEIAVARGLAQTLENTVYSFATVVAIYLVGAACGAIWRSLFPRRRAMLLLGLALGTLWCAAGVWLSGDLYATLRTTLAYGLFAEVVVTAMVFLPAATVMGALFADLAQEARGPKGGLGLAFAANLFGGALAPPVVGLVLIGTLGAIPSLVALSLCYAIMALVLASSPLPRIVSGAIATAASGLMIFWPGILTRGGPTEQIVLHDDSPFSSATVLEDDTGTRRLVVDGRFAMGSESTEVMDRLQGHLPLLLHPKPERALFLGLGTGATFAAAAHHPGLVAEAVELSPAVVRTLPWFRAAWEDLSSEALTVHTGDARRWVRTGDTTYDVIIADTFHPARDGTSLLYTTEHFAIVRDRLADGGLFAQWLPLHQFDMQTLKLVTASFQEIFPDATLHVANASLATPLVALIGYAGERPDVETLLEPPGDRALSERLFALGLTSPLDVLGSTLAGPKGLSAFVDGQPANRDAFPRVLFTAPASVYATLDPAMDRLSLLMTLDRSPADVLSFLPRQADQRFAARLEAYWRARDSFVNMGRGAALTGRADEDAARLGPELVSILRESPDYTPAWRALSGLAEALGRGDPARAAAFMREARAAVADGKP